jgi:single-stranded DNA-binding protein
MTGKIEAKCMGEVISEASLRTVGDGKRLLTFSLAVGGDGTGHGRQFVRVAAWGARAESLAPVIAMGRLVRVEGALTLAQWEGHGKQKRFGLHLDANRVELVRPAVPPGPPPATVTVRATLGFAP